MARKKAHETAPASYLDINGRLYKVELGRTWLQATYHGSYQQARNARTPWHVAARDRDLVVEKVKEAQAKLAGPVRTFTGTWKFLP